MSRFTWCLFIITPHHVNLFSPVNQKATVDDLDGIRNEHGLYQDSDRMNVAAKVGRLHAITISCPTVPNCAIESHPRDLTISSFRNLSLRLKCQTSPHDPHSSKAFKSSGIQDCSV